MLRYTVLWCKASFDILNRVDVAHECDGRRDRQTDFAAANATLHYVVRPKIKKNTDFIVMVISHYFVI